MNTTGAWAAIVASSLHRGGVRNVVVSPGSRSTPFVHACVSHDGLSVFDVIDERAAAFFALGMVRALDRPVALLCTSGSAPAHYFPAVVEAAASHLPLVIVSADRPLRLQGCGANQTVDQVKLFGDHARLFVDLGEPRGDEAAGRGARNAVLRAVRAATTPTPGPVHINARADKPLEPGPAKSLDDKRGAEALSSVLAEPAPEFFSMKPAADPAAVELVAQALATARRPAIVCGPAPAGRAPLAVAELADRVGAALLLETTSQLRDRGAAAAAGFADRFDAWLSADRATFEPDVLLCLDAFPTSGAFASWLQRATVRRLVVAEHGLPDPMFTAEAMITASPALFVDSLLARLEQVSSLKHVSAASGGSTSVHDVSANDGAWLPALRKLVDETEAAVCAVLDDDRLGEGAAIFDAVASLHEGDVLTLGNSLVVREVDIWAAPLPKGVAVLHQRGASGIDGLVAGAAGAATALQRPTMLLLGDVSLRHDIGALAVARHCPVPLSIVVVHNGGGRIFEQLPVADSPALEHCFEHWTTPSDESFLAAARGLGVRAERAETRESLREALSTARRAPGCTVIEAVVPPHSARRERTELLRRIETVSGGSSR